MAQFSTPGSQPSTAHYGYDGHGSVRFLTDSDSGAATDNTDTYDYDAYGQLLATTGTTVNNYRYTGEQWDADLGMYYLRARYLNPNTGRFWTMDGYEGGQGDPLSLHKYLYCHADPANGVDPSGNYAGTIEFGIASTIALNIRATWEANRVTIYGSAIAAALAVATYYGAATINEWMQMRDAQSALESAGTFIRNELAKARNLLNRTLRNLKVVPMPRSVIKDVANHVATAQTVGGHPMMLTRVSPAQARINRRLATGSLGAAGTRNSWDEYPFASGRTSMMAAPSVVAVPKEQNWIQGGIIAICYKLEKINVGDNFLVVVTP